MKLEVYNFLKSEAEADKNKALASIELLTNHPAGIGDHSTKDYWDAGIRQFCTGTRSWTVSTS